MDIKAVFGDNVRRYRQQKGLSQDDFSELCGMHHTYISHIENHRLNVSIENVQKIAEALEIESYKLLIDDSKNIK